MIRQVAASLPEFSLAGFITDEIRTERGREGFRLTTLDGRDAVMAHVDFRTPHRVGKYKVDVKAVDQLVHSALMLDANVDIYLVDEIGKMECLSRVFVSSMRSVLDSGKPVVASIAMRGVGFISEVKKREDCVIWEVTRHNRGTLKESVLDWIRSNLRHG